MCIIHFFSLSIFLWLESLLCFVMKQYLGPKSFFLEIVGCFSILQTIIIIPKYKILKSFQNKLNSNTSLIKQINLDLFSIYNLSDRLGLELGKIKRNVHNTNDLPQNTIFLVKVKKNIVMLDLRMYLLPQMIRLSVGMDSLGISGHCILQCLLFYLIQVGKSATRRCISYLAQLNKSPVYYCYLSRL